MLPHSTAQGHHRKKRLVKHTITALRREHLAAHPWSSQPQWQCHSLAEDLRLTCQQITYGRIISGLLALQGEQVGVRKQECSRSHCCSTQSGSLRNEPLDEGTYPFRSQNFPQSPYNLKLYIFLLKSLFFAQGSFKETSHSVLK